MIDLVISKLTYLITSDSLLMGKGEDSLLEGFTIENGKCIFTLDSLYQSIRDDIDLDYAEFRSQLYSSDVNKRLRDLGYMIEVSESTGKVDSSTYQLAKL